MSGCDKECSCCDDSANEDRQCKCAMCFNLAKVDSLYCKDHSLGCKRKQQDNSQTKSDDASMFSDFCEAIVWITFFICCTISYTRPH